MSPEQVAIAKAFREVNGATHVMQGYRFQTVAEMSAVPTAKDHLIKGIFAKGESSAWIAPPGGMKSALLAQAAVSVSAGLDWNGYRNKGASGVVYFALERADLVRRRILAHIARQGLPALPIVAVGDMVDPRNFKKIVATIREAEDALGIGVGLVIFDTFAKLIAAAGGDENNAKDQGMVFANLQRVKNDTGAHIALIGHTGKDESRGARGSNAILGDVDLMVTITGEGEIRTATVTKANDAPEGPLFSFKSEVRDFGHDEDGDPITVNIVSGEAVSETVAKRRDRWPKGLRLVRDAVAEAVTSLGKSHRVGGDGPSVTAVDLKEARRVHMVRYVGTGDGNREAAERQAWGRSLKKARDEALIGCELANGLEFVWLIND